MLYLTKKKRRGDVTTGKGPMENHLGLPGIRKQISKKKKKKSDDVLNKKKVKTHWSD